MAWVEMEDRINPPFVWFEATVNSDIYLAKVLKNSVWHAVKAAANRR